MRTRNPRLPTSCISDIAPTQITPLGDNARPVRTPRGALSSGYLAPQPIGSGWGRSLETVLGPPGHYKYTCTCLVQHQPLVFFCLENNVLNLIMSLTAKQKATVREFFSKMSARSEDIGAEALSRYGVYFFVR